MAPLFWDCTGCGRVQPLVGKRTKKRYGIDDVKVVVSGKGKDRVQKYDVHLKGVCNVCTKEKESKDE